MPKPLWVSECPPATAWTFIICSQEQAKPQPRHEIATRREGAQAGGWGGDPRPAPSWRLHESEWPGAGAQRGGGRWDPGSHCRAHPQVQCPSELGDLDERWLCSIDFLLTPPPPKQVSPRSSPSLDGWTGFLCASPLGTYCTLTRLSAQPLPSATPFTGLRQSRALLGSQRRHPATCSATGPAVCSCHPGGLPGPKEERLPLPTPSPQHSPHFLQGCSICLPQSPCCGGSWAGGGLVRK